jgi:hypothetical protein
VVGAALQVPQKRCVVVHSVAVLALALFAFYTSLGGQKVFQGSLLVD